MFLNWLAWMGNGLVMDEYSFDVFQAVYCWEAKMGNFLWLGTVAVWGYGVFAYQFLVQCVDYLMVGLETSLICLRAVWLVNDSAFSVDLVRSFLLVLMYMLKQNG
jgi:hypothetical protein